MQAAPAHPALDPASAPVDGKRARDRLAFAAQFARLIRFYGLDNRPDGDWQVFLLKDPAILLATIGATDYQGLHAQHDTLVRATRVSAEAQRALLPALLGLLRQMFSTLAQWQQWLDLQPAEFPLRAFLAHAVHEQLAPDLARTRHLHQALAERRLADWPDLPWYRSLGPAWQSPLQPGPQDLPEQLHDEEAVFALALAALRQRYLATLDVMIQTVDAAASCYEQVAGQSTPHPDTALLRVFVELMQYQQETMNRIGRRHLDFYYERVLQMAARKAEPDHVTVLLTAANGQASVTIPAGTRFSAGKDASGTALWYSNPDQAVINSARTLAAFSLKAQSGAAAQGFAPGIHLARLADTENLQFDPAGHALDQSVFGTPALPAQGLGFALASPMLLLEGGSRTITVSIEMGALATPLPQAWAQGWQCWLSGAKGWFDAGPYALPPHWEAADGDQPARLLLELMLPAEAPPVLAPVKPLDGRPCPWPQLKFALPPLASAHPWPKLEAVRLEVKVRDLLALQQYNELGPTSGSGAAPFGPVPLVGNRFFVGSREIFAKPVDKLSLTLEWASLAPKMDDWYREYNQWQSAQRPDWAAFGEGVHQGSWQWLQADGWQAPALSVPLGNQTGALFQNKAKSVFTFRFGAAFKPDPQLATCMLPAPQAARAGYLALTLQSPAQAFGHQQYPQVLIWSSQQQAARRKASAPPLQPPATPNLPFTPALRTVSADYAASCRVVPGADAGHAEPACPVQWIHYGPGHNWLVWQSGERLLKLAPLAPGLRPDGLTLVPPVAESGALLLALDALCPPCSLRLFACVSDDGDGAGFDAWLYGADGWQAQEMRRDDSGGLSGSGLVELHVAGSTAALPLVPELAASAWLALTPRGPWRALRLALLATQAVWLQRQDLAADCEQVAPLAPASIKKPPLPELAAVRQPLASQGGRGGENRDGYQGQNNYYARVSERLLHKGRALTPRDFVLLAHQTMPGLHRVQLLPRPLAARGEVRLGVVPRISHAGAAGAFTPRLSPDARMRLAAALQAGASGAARVAVHNLAPRELRLAARLILAPDAQAAWPALRQQWNQALRLYLSPWIDSGLPQYDMGHGLARAGLLYRLAAFPGVLAIEELHITVADTNGQARPTADEHMLPPPGALWVSALQHELTLAGD